MSKIAFLAHLPLLRIAEEEIPFADGTLWRLPFDVYDNLTLGAFKDHQKAYEATAPVFYRVDADLDVPLGDPSSGGRTSAIEMKIPAGNLDMLARLGMRFVLRFKRNFVGRARAALLLAAPASGIPDADLSVAFAHLTESGVFQVGDNLVSDTIRVQGEADQEYLFFPEAAGLPLSIDVVRDAERCLAIVDHLDQQPDLLAATKAFLGSTAPVLSPMDQLVLSVRAIEALLLPDVTRGMGGTFAQRLSRLLAVDPAHVDVLQRHARTLYDARSSKLHGEAPKSSAAAETAAAQAHAQQLLAASIRRLAKHSGKTSIAEQREALDLPEPDYDVDGAAVPLPEPAGLRRAERMLQPPSNFVSTISTRADMSVKDGTGSWSPLIGLQMTMEAGALSRAPEGVAIMTLSGDEMVALEERDIRRDFMGQLGVDGQPAAVLLAAMPGELARVTTQSLAPLLRRRELATVALRLAGFQKFHDPELLGVFVYQDSLRTRFPSVFRQTIEQKMLHAAEETFTDSGLAEVATFMQLLMAYDKTARHPDVDQVLRSFRLGFYHDFLPLVSRANLLLSAVEMMLGRFREPQELETLVAVTIQEKFPEAATWFRARGRRFRNSMAHGEWPDPQREPQPLAQLIDAVRGLIVPFVQTWSAQPDRGTASPLQMFLAASTKRAARKPAG